MASRLFQGGAGKKNAALCYDIHAFDWGYSDSGVIGLHARDKVRSKLRELTTVSLGIFSDLAEHGANRAGGDGEIQGGK